MSENSMSIQGNNPVQKQSFSSKGVSLASLKESNELLFNYFKKQGYKEDAIIYSSDVDRMTKEFDESGNGKLSIKEARAMGLEGSRSEVRAALKQMKEIANTELKEGAFHPVAVNENETDFYTQDGKLLSNTKVDENKNKIETFFINGDREKLDKMVTTSADGSEVVTKEFLDGDKTKVLKETVKYGNTVAAETSYDWFNGKLNSVTNKKGNDVETTIYKEVNGVSTPERIVRTFNSDRKNHPNGMDYETKTCIEDLKYLKGLINSAVKSDENIPKDLYSFTPSKNGDYKSIAQEIRMYEAVFGKGSSGYTIT